MTFNQHDPVWTTFILEPDSLPAEQRQTLEQELATNAACQQFVAELRVAAGVLKSELQAEMQPTVGVKETLAAVNKASVAPRNTTRFTTWQRIALGTSLAVLLVGIVVGSLSSVRNSSVHELVDLSEAIGEINITEPNSGFLDSASFVDGSRSMDVDAAVIEVEGVENQTPRTGRFMFGVGDNGDPVKAPSSTSSTAEREKMERELERYQALSSAMKGPVHVPSEEEVRRYRWKAANDQLPVNSPELAQTRLDRDSQFTNESDERRLKTRIPIGGEAPNTETYPALPENPFIKPEGLAALSTFSIDVDTASYSNVRRFLQHATQPPPGAVRLEEMINYFRYDYAPPKDDKPFAVHVETAACPWEPKHRLARVALKGKVIDQDKRPASNLVFLLDVSGSMDQPNKLPLVKRSLQMLVEQLTENDRVAIAVYAGSSGLVLDSTPGNNKQIILNAIDNLQPSGSTNGAAGIKVAYEAAVKGFIPKATNRVILCTDGDFNVGVSSDDELVDLITEKAKTGVFLSVFGFGMGNLKDAKMLGLADKGNGNYAYIDNVREANKVLVEQMSGTLVTIAKDVKIQVEFNPQKVAAYRLIGYEKRMLAAQDFKDDKKDAGEIGAGHTVTAFYEIVPAGEANPAEKIDPLEFQPDKTKPKTAELPAELAELAMRVKLRYKQPDGDTSVEFAVGVPDETKPFAAGSKDFQFAAAVAGFGRVLRGNEQQAKITLDAIHEIAASAKGEDPSGYRAEFVDLVTKAKQLPALRKTDAAK